MSEDRESFPFYQAKIEQAMHDVTYGNKKPTGANPAIQVKNEKMQCEHRRLIVYDLQTRTIECDDCKKILDPFDWVVRCAHDELRCVAEVEIWRRMRGEYNEANKIKKEHEHWKMQRRCMHTYAKPLSSGGAFCPTCDKFIPPEPIPIGSVS